MAIFFKLLINHLIFFQSQYHSESDTSKCTRMAQGHQSTAKNKPIASRTANKANVREKMVQHQRHDKAKDLVKPQTSKCIHLPQYIDKPSRSICKNKCGGLSNFFCSECDAFLCFTNKRNCFLDFHRKDNNSYNHLPEFRIQSSRSRCQLQCGKNVNNLTNVFCAECDMYLCLNHNRNCFKNHHDAQ